MDLLAGLKNILSHKPKKIDKTKSAASLDEDIQTAQTQKKHTKWLTEKIREHVCTALSAKCSLTNEELLKKLEKKRLKKSKKEAIQKLIKTIDETTYSNKSNHSKSKLIKLAKEALE